MAPRIRPCYAGGDAPAGRRHASKADLLSRPTPSSGPTAPGGDPLLLFAVGGTVCALRRAAVRELLPLPRLWRPPGLPQPVAGFLNLGGEALPVLELGRLLGVAEDAAVSAGGLYRHLILLHPGEAPGRVALLVDRVLDLVPAPAAASLAAPSDAGGADPCVEAEVVIGEALVPLLDPARLLRRHEAAILAALAADAQRRREEWSVAAP